MPNTALPILGWRSPRRLPPPTSRQAISARLPSWAKTTNGSDGKLYVYAIAGGSITAARQRVP